MSQKSHAHRKIHPAIVSVVHARARTVGFSEMTRLDPIALANKKSVWAQFLRSYDDQEEETEMRLFRGLSLALVLVLAAPALLQAQAQTETQTTPRTMERENEMDWGWLGLLGLAGLFGLQGRRHDVHRDVTSERATATHR
jgi:MYXO-CTERM domain-containing protein